MPRFRNTNSHWVYVRDPARAQEPVDSPEVPPAPLVGIAGGGEVDATGEFADNLAATNGVERVGQKKRSPAKKSGKKSGEKKSGKKKEPAGVTGSAEPTGAVTTADVPTRGG